MKLESVIFITYFVRWRGVIFHGYAGKDLGHLEFHLYKELAEHKVITG